MGSFVTAYHQADIFGRMIILGLVFLSLLCWVLSIYKIWLTRHVRRTSYAFYETYQKNKESFLQLEPKNLPQSNHQQIPHPFGEVFSMLKNKTLEILNKNLYFSQNDKGQVYLSSTDLEIIESCGLNVISGQTKALEKNLFILSTIVTLAPFLGLLGTVWGILVTFSGLTGGLATSNSAILGGLSTALVTTVLGLIIAIPALISYNYLKTTLKDYSSDMEDFLYDLLSTVELQYRKADIS